MFASVFSGGLTWGLVLWVFIVFLVASIAWGLGTAFLAALRGGR